MMLNNTCAICCLQAKKLDKQLPFAFTLYYGLTSSTEGTPTLTNEYLYTPQHTLKRRTVRDKHTVGTAQRTNCPGWHRVPQVDNTET